MLDQYIARAIVRHLGGDRPKANEYANRATELYKQNKHLYVSIKDILREKGEVG